jgi:glycosyltransferase involved in cell wall biosynthesis
VASRTGGLPEVVREGETGALRPVGDVEAMAQAAVEILSDRSRWQRMSAAAAGDARARFSLDRILAQYEQLYADALG